MSLYCSPTCPYSHQVRFVWHEKGVQADIHYIDPENPPADVIDLNPYHESVFTTLIDRDLVLYDHRIIMEYLDERFPHPPLHPMEPVARAQARMLIHRIDRDWYRLLDEIQNSGEKKAARARKTLREDLIAATPLFAAKPYFLSEEFSLVDCALAPLLWRLPAVGIDLPREAAPIRAYAQRIFAREAFQSSLSEAEREMAQLPLSA
ncbi:stringent starvation protein A [Methylomarinovum caldicuralii]|uniref:Stringent starvation protein A n=1 Tax=Methylomarinovum caldicuralii TaxID=438856 RepID=A0AAU9BRM4_9GAMM|nr:glutathione S-transferase C-terminal domain-containing protein [Methylomarinovum caldicuralii]BCX81468.1 stringent starvation protein A [Methylomarinovum caldicuralii]